MCEEQEKPIKPTQPGERRESFDDMDKSITNERPEPLDTAPTERPAPPVDQTPQDSGSDSSESKD